MKPILSLYSGKREELISILQKVQDKFGYLSDDAMIDIAKFVNLPKNEVYSVALFYDRFKFKPLERRIITVCTCPSCYLKGALLILRVLEHKIGGMERGATSDRGIFLETKPCVECCGLLSPCLIVNGKIYSNMTAREVIKLLKEIKDK